MKLSNAEIKQFNEILVLAYQDGEELALDKLIEINQGLIQSVVNSFKNIYYIEDEEKMSLCYIGFYEAAKNYKTEGNSVFGTYATNCMRTEILNKIQWFKYKDRIELEKQTESMHKKVSGKDGETELGDILMAMETKDKYFDYEYINVKPAIDFAITKVREDLRPYIVPILIGDMKQRDLVEDTGICKKLLNYYLRVFKKNFQSYTLEHNLV